MMVRSLAELVDLWPRCGQCEHATEEHAYGQCSRLGCACRGYVGPTVAEFCRRFLTPEEVKHYFTRWD